MDQILNNWVWSSVQIDFGSQRLCHSFIVCKDLHRTVVLILEFAQSLRVQIDWNSHGMFYLHQDHNPLTDFMANENKFLSRFF